jgi:hypothetical protein
VLNLQSPHRGRPSSDRPPLSVNPCDQLDGCTRLDYLLRRRIEPLPYILDRRFDLGEGFPARVLPSRHSTLQVRSQPVPATRQHAFDLVPAIHGFGPKLIGVPPGAGLTGVCRLCRPPEPRLVVAAPRATGYAPSTRVNSVSRQETFAPPQAGRKGEPEVILPAKTGGFSGHGTGKPPPLAPEDPIRALFISARCRMFLAACPSRHRLRSQSGRLCPRVASVLGT